MSGKEPPRAACPDWKEVPINNGGQSMAFPTTFRPYAGTETSCSQGAWNGTSSICGEAQPGWRGAMAPIRMSRADVASMHGSMPAPSWATSLAYLSSVQVQKVTNCRQRGP